jgi:hypothetical protein
LPSRYPASTDRKPTAIVNRHNATERGNPTARLSFARALQMLGSHRSRVWDNRVCAFWDSTRSAQSGKVTRANCRRARARTSVTRRLPAAYRSLRRFSGTAMRRGPGLTPPAPEKRQGTKWRESWHLPERTARRPAAAIARGPISPIRR